MIFKDVHPFPRFTETILRFRNDDPESLIRYSKRERPVAEINPRLNFIVTDP